MSERISFCRIESALSRLGPWLGMAVTPSKQLTIPSAHQNDHSAMSGHRCNSGTPQFLLVPAVGVYQRVVLDPDRYPGPADNPVPFAPRLLDSFLDLLGSWLSEPLEAPLGDLAEVRGQGFLMAAQPSRRAGS